MSASESTPAPIERVCPHPLRPLVVGFGRYFAPRCPPWLAPEAIACSGFAFALVAGAAFYLAGFHRGWLWVVLPALALQQLADWADGAVARHRGLASDHGMLLDIFIDDLSFTVIAVGLACSPFATFHLTMLAAVVYLLNDIAVNLRIHFLRVHEIPFISPAEICALFMAATLLSFFFPPPVVTVGHWSLGWFDLFFIPATIYGVIEMLVSVRRLYSTLLKASR